MKSNHCGRCWILSLVCLAGSAFGQGSAPELTDDTVLLSNSTVSLYPLANDTDPDGDVLTISSVSDTAVSIQGRRLIIGTTVGDSFTYQATDGTNTSTATVTVQRIPALLNSRRFTGLLYGSDGTIAGRVKMVDTRRGIASIELVMGTRRVAGRFPFGRRGGHTRTVLGTLVLTRNPNGTLGATMGEIAGVLRACPNAAASELHHIALTNIGNLLPPPATAEGEPTPSNRIPGGGYVIIRLRRNANVIVSGRLPDGCPFTVGSFLTDIKTIPLYFAQNTRTAARGLVAGQLLRVSLPRTDVTGEFVWNKPPQELNTPYPNRNGIETVLLANGCLHSAEVLAGPATLRLAGGDLAADEIDSVTMTANRPNPAGSLMEWVPKPYGAFVVKLRFATGDPIIGAGIYLSKTKRAWGYFPGEEQGGCVDLQLSTPP
jgi:hypothetical protein